MTFLYVMSNHVFDFFRLTCQMPLVRTVRVRNEHNAVSTGGEIHLPPFTEGGVAGSLVRANLGLNSFDQRGKLGPRHLPTKFSLL
ncbi:hypothetical protein D3C76_608180 [compost metagenome]